jgi:RNA polymerase-binding transcription factor DksA
MSRYEAEARDLLLRRRTMLRRRAAAPVAPAGADPAARWTDYESAGEPLPSTAQRELAEIEAALGRLASGSYGTCQSCGGPMGLQRIRAIPEARFCVGCSGQGLEAE